MKEDIKKFRKIVKIMIENKMSDKKEITKQLDVAPMTLVRLLTTEINTDFKVKASVLGKIQDFNKENRNVLMYGPPGTKENEDAEEKKEPLKNPDNFWKSIAGASHIIPPGVKIIIKIQKTKS